MHTSALLLTAAVAVGIQAQDITGYDIPPQCKIACAELIQSNIDCISDANGDGFVNCLCGSQAAAKMIPNCEACVAQFRQPDNDVRDLVSSCSFDLQTTWFNPGQASQSTFASVPATPSSSVITISGSDGATFTVTGSQSTTRGRGPTDDTGTGTRPTPSPRPSVTGTGGAGSSPSLTDTVITIQTSTETGGGPGTGGGQTETSTEALTQSPTGAAVAQEVSSFGGLALGIFAAVGLL